MLVLSISTITFLSLHYKFNPYINLSEEQQDLINNFVVSGSAEMYRWWVSTKKKLPLDEVISLSSNLLNNGVSQYIRSN